MHACFGAQPAVGVVACKADGGALDARNFALADVDDFGLVAVGIAPAQVHAQQHVRPVLRLGAAGASLNVEERAVRIHLAGEHATELELLEVSLDPCEVRIHTLRRGFVVFLDGHVEQLGGVVQGCADAVQHGDDLLKAYPLATELLGLVRRVPDRRIFEFAAYFSEPFALGVVLKETPEALYSAR